MGCELTHCNTVIIYCLQLKKYEVALELLLTQQPSNMQAALRFCAWCASLEARQRVAELSALWLPASGDPHNTQTASDRAADAYTVLLQLLLNRWVSGVEDGVR